MTYSVTGTLNPDATAPSLGLPAGTYNGKNYWAFDPPGTGGGTWYLAWVVAGSKPATPAFWCLWSSTNGFPVPSEWNNPTGKWVLQSSSDDPSGSYSPKGLEEYTGTATVSSAVYAAVYAALTINDGPLAGQYIVLKTG
jgi:hypothetical protein